MRESEHEFAARVRPQLPRPGCRVMLICGPPAAGKTTYVKAHAGPDDIVIDFDEIAAEQGYSRDRPGWAVGHLLELRNARLAELAMEAPDRVAWVILTAPSASLRRWWCDVLGAKDVVVLAPPWKEIYRRIMTDSTRAHVRMEQLQKVRKWFAQEARNDPGTVRSDVGADGYPTDPLHAWNR